jgi:uncharacterized membrane protein
MFDRVIYILENTTFAAPPAVKVLAIALAVVGLLVVLWSYARTPARARLRLAAALLKAIGMLVLAVCLGEPYFHELQPRPGANLFLIVADNSQSLLVKDRGERQSRGEQLRRALTAQSDWQTRLGQDFDVRRYVFDTRPRPVADFQTMSFEGDGSSLAGSLMTLAKRHQGRPNAGVLLLTDGNATDFSDEAIPWSELPPVFPVVLGDDLAAKDLSVTRVSASQTNFEAAPVTISAEIEGQGYSGDVVVAQLLGENDEEVDRKTLRNLADGKPQVVRFQLRPEKAGVSFYRVRALADSAERDFEQPARSQEATLANNSRMVLVDRGQGPYRVLYVAGRPNWEYKFLRRAIEEDGEVNLVGLLRIAKREPKFTFRGQAGERTNPLFRGFGTQDEEANSYDQPVVIRLGTEDDQELREGFPKAAEQLFQYHAIILDDLEAAFFTQDQMSLMYDFVSQRGGGFLMLGGQESFAGGEYRRTPIGELLPIYLDRVRQSRDEQGFRLELTREGWLQPWIRLRATEQGEEKRLAEMPAFKTLNQAPNIKPAAAILARVRSSEGNTFPALVAQPFGKGRSAALLVGDMWLWNLRRENAEASDLEKAWRQIVRWLVADVPQRIEVETRRKLDEPSAPVHLEIRVLDPMFKPLDNAAVEVRVKTPDDHEIAITAEPGDEQAGVYWTDFVSRQPGAYRAKVSVTAADGTEVGQRDTGWTAEPATDEFRTLRPNRSLLERIARETNGQVVALNELNSFMSKLPTRRVPVVEARITPLWHDWRIMLLAAGLLVGEWGVRRWKGLP